MEAAAKSCINCFQALEDSAVCPRCGFDEIKHKIIFYHLKPRTVLYSKYLLGKALYEDSFGITYTAAEIDSGKRFMVKELFPAGIAKRVNYTTTMVRVDENYAEFFDGVKKNFANIAQKLVSFSEQSKVLRYRDFFLGNDSAYLVEEIVEGVTLAEYLRDNGNEKLGFKEAMQLIWPVIMVLGNIHKQDVIHAAINPGNILLNAEKEISLTNFDFSGEKIISPSRESAPVNKKYVAPERYAQDAQEGPWTDIYSLAAVIYTAITSNDPPAASKPPAANERAETEAENKEPVISLKDAGVEITPEDEATLLKALSPEIQDRPQSMEEFAKNLAVLQDFATEEELSFNGQESPEKKSAPETPASSAMKEELKENPPPEPPAESAMFSDEQSLCGNTPGNIVNGGLVAGGDNYVYYKNPVDFGKLYRTTATSRESEKICDDDISCINVIGGWVYYSNTSDKGRIYKLWVGSGYKTKLGNDTAEFVNISDGWVYYRNKSDFGKIYKIKTNGADRAKLTDHDAAYLNVSGDWVYYSNKSDNGSLYKIKTDGSGQQKLSGDTSEYLNTEDGWIYYINRSENNKLYKIGTDGENKTKLSDDNIFNVNVSGEWAYYSNESDGGKLYKARIKGLLLSPFFAWLTKILPGIFQNRVKLNNDSGKSINVVDDWLYYYKVPDNTLHKIKIDGSSHRLVE